MGRGTILFAVRRVLQSSYRTRSGRNQKSLRRTTPRFRIVCFVFVAREVSGYLLSRSHCQTSSPHMHNPGQRDWPGSPTGEWRGFLH